ncbi:MAG: hypothetical protein P8P30_03305 [Rickettsiales bacterium]|nr:hypothetical protein [Rickettsiales bacterium]
MRRQSPVDSITSNNLSTIYDSLDANGEQVALLYGAHNKKDSSYVSANLAKAYADAGFIEKAKKCLEHLTKEQQRETIVIGAYEKIESVEKNNEAVNEKLAEAISLQRNLMNEALASAASLPQDLASSDFSGSWGIGGETSSLVIPNKDILEITLHTSNQDFKKAKYSTESTYQDGILEIQASLDMNSLTQSGEVSTRGLGLLSSPLLFSTNRPPDHVNFLLFMNKNGMLKGLRWTVDTNKSDIQNMLNAETVYLTKTSASNGRKKASQSLSDKITVMESKNDD